MRILVIALLVAVSLSGCSAQDEATSETPVPPGSLHGRLANPTDLPVAGARISLVGTEHFTDSDGKGRFHFDGLIAGPYTVSVQTESYLPVQEEIDVVAADTVHLNLTLELDPSLPSNPHVHDYWKGRDLYTMMDGTIDITRDPPYEERFLVTEEETHGRVTMPNGLSFEETFFIPVLEAPDGPAAVLPGTQTMRITLDWDPADLGFERVGVRYGPPNVDGGETDLIAPGETAAIDVTPEMWDDGHKDFTRWFFRGFHDNHADDPTNWNPIVVLDGSMDVTIELERGELRLDAAHPDHWGERDRLVVREFEEPSGGAPIGVGRRSAQGSMLLDDEQIVPPGATSMRMVFRWTQSTGNGTSDMEDFKLTWRTAGQNPQTTGVSDFERADAVEGSAAEQYKVYEIDLAADDADGMYDTGSAWRFSPWDPSMPEDGYRVNGGTFFDLKVTVYR